MVDELTVDWGEASKRAKPNRVLNVSADTESKQRPGKADSGPIREARCEIDTVVTSVTPACWQKRQGVETPLPLSPSRHHLAIRIMFLNRLFLAFVLLPGCFILPSLRANEPVYDVVVYGGNAAGIVAAVQTKRMGKTVVVVCPDKHLGGLTSGGLGWTDSGNKDAIGGIAREFYHRVWQHYQTPDAWRWQDQADFGNRNQSPPGKRGDGSTMWVFEPHVAEDIFESMVSEYDIPVHRDHWIHRDPEIGVESINGRISAIRMLDGTRFQGKMFIDATYEGDLMAVAGVDFHVGREANAVYDETWNGVQVGVLHHKHWFAKPIDPYLVAGDPNSGTLPLISMDPPGTRGDGDDRIQAYCFRMCLTNVKENQIPFAKPTGYTPDRYELLRRVFEGGWREMFQKFDPLPNHKTDTNNHGPVSTDYIGMNYDYPNASYERRREIIREHELYQKGLMYFMANDPGVPADIREAISKWGLAKDEFTDNGGWPHQIYVREARRMIGDYVMTEHDCLDKKQTPQSVGMGSYTLDSHNVQRYIKPDGMVQNEGDIGVRTPRPYQIAYGSLVPKKQQTQNLLVPVCVSSSHIAFGSIRMEPVFMILGQSAATAACLAIEQDVALQDLDYATLRDRLIQDGQVLEMENVYEFESKTLPGVVVDDRYAELVGPWKTSSANRRFVDSGYRHNDNDRSANSTATYRAQLSPGNYEVRLSYAANKNRATNVPVDILHADGKSRVFIDQQKTPEKDGLFQVLGTYRFSTDGSVVIGTDSTDGYVVIDAVQFVAQ